MRPCLAFAFASLLAGCWIPRTEVLFPVATSLGGPSMGAVVAGDGVAVGVNLDRQDDITIIVLRVSGSVHTHHPTTRALREDL